MKTAVSFYTFAQDVNIRIKKNQLYGLIGPNGAGKSTLLKAILGEISHEGTLSFVDEKDKKTREPNIGYVPQTLEFDRTSPISVKDLFNVILITFLKMFIFTL